MSIYGKAETVIYSNDFKYVSEIMKTLSKKEINLMDGWSGESSNHTVFREVLLINNKPVAFVEIDQFKNSSNASPNEGFVGIACRGEKEYRRKGYPSMVLERAINWAKRNKEITRLIWLVKTKNVSSIKLAKKFGFQHSNTKTNTGWTELYLEV